MGVVQKPGKPTSNFPPSLTLMVAGQNELMVPAINSEAGKCCTTADEYRLGSDELPPSTRIQEHHQI
jgi:hypothetical protein